MSAEYPCEDDYEDDEVDGCLHGIPWDEECPWCEDDGEDMTV